MIRLFRQNIHNLSIQKKLLSCFLLICLLCFTALFFIAIPQISRISEMNVFYSASQALEQASEYISFRMNNLRQTSYSIAYNENILQILSKDPKEYSLLEQSSDNQTLSNYRQQVLVSHSQTLEDVYFCVNDNFSFVSDKSSYARSFLALQEQNWYRAMQQHNRAYYYIPPHWNRSPNIISIAHLISSPQDYSAFIAAIVLDIPVSPIQDILMKCAVTTNSYVYLFNDEGILVTASSDMLPATEFTVFRSFLEENKAQDQDNLYFSKRLDSCGWTLVQVIPKTDIWDIRIDSLRTILLVCVPLLLASAFLSLRLSSSITRRLKSLSTAMRLFRYQEATPFSVSNQGDEIDYLLKSYNTLISTLDQLTRENIQKEQRISETELAVLHSQIKSHLLFNTLDMIQNMMDNGEAAMASEALMALANFYRSGLGNNHTIWSTLKRELDHVRSYMEIQRIRYQNRVQLDIQIDENLLDVNLPRITLQPIVENALIHGILDQDEASGKITIHAEKMDEHVLHLTIRDDGKGIPEDKMTELLKPEHFGNGLGLANTNRRIRLHYGNDYGLSVYSTENQYTEIVIRIPILRGKEHFHDDIDCR